MKSNKKITPALIAEILGKKKGKWEELAKSNDPIKKRTGEYKLGRIQTLLDQVFELQESFKPQESEVIMRNGGQIDPFMYQYYLINQRYGSQINKDLLERLESYNEQIPAPIPENISILHGNYLPNLKEYNRSTLQKQSNLNTPSVTKSGNFDAAFNVPEEQYIDDIPFDTSKIATKKVMREYKNPGLYKTLNWAGKNIAGIAQGASILGDYISQMAYINKMEEPTKVAFAPRVTLNKNMDTSAYKRQAARALRTGYKQTDNMQSQVGAAVRGSMLGSYINNLGDINTQASNYRMQMENQEAGINQQVGAQNAMILNDLYNRQNMFRNQRYGAKQQALSGLFTKAQLMGKEYTDRKWMSKIYGNKVMEYLKSK